jgi:hypothetical protein
MIYRVPGWVGWIAFGALLEIAIFFSALPKHSEDPTTPWQMVAGYLLMPGGAAFGGLAWTFGHAIDRIFPPSLATVVLTSMMIVGFLTEAAMLALPFWVLTRVTLRRLRSI